MLLQIIWTIRRLARTAADVQTFRARRNRCELPFVIGSLVMTGIFAIRYCTKARLIAVLIISIHE
jgi:hypothetical protein